MLKALLLRIKRRPPEHPLSRPHEEPPAARKQAHEISRFRISRSMVRAASAVGFSMPHDLRMVRRFDPTVRNPRRRRSLAADKIVRRCLRSASGQLTISSIVRAHPMQNPLASSNSQMPIHGEAIIPCFVIPSALSCPRCGIDSNGSRPDDPCLVLRIPVLSYL